MPFAPQDQDTHMPLAIEDRTMIDLMLPNELGYAKVVWQLIGWLAPRLPLAASRVADLQTAVSEACINAIEHGNQLVPSSRIHVRLIMTPAYIEAVVRDEGIVRFQPVKTQPASIEQKVAGLAQPRGMGLLLMQQLADECEVIAGGPGDGNRCRLRVYT